MSRTSLNNPTPAGGSPDPTTILPSTANFDVIEGANLQAQLDSIDNYLLNARSTGVLYGGGLTDNGAASVTFAAGKGQILRNAVPSAPIFYGIEWAETTIDLSGPNAVYYIYVDIDNVVKSTTTAPSHVEYRDFIWLWRISIRSSAVSGTTSIGMPVQQESAQIWDLFRALGPIKLGLTPSAASTDLTVAVSSGEVYIPGIQITAEARNPHEIDIAAASPVTFRHVVQNSTQISGDVTILDVANYDDGSGGVIAIPGASSRAQIFTVMLFPGSLNYRFFYGQTIYNTIEDGLADIGNYSPVIPQAFQDGALTLGYIIVSKGCTDLSDTSQAIFVATNRFGGIGGGVGATASGSIPDNSITYDKLQLAAADNVVLGNNAGTNQPYTEITMSALRAMLGIEQGGAYARVEDQKTNTTNGGSSVNGFQIRTLNTIAEDPNSIISSLATNQVTLPAGTYIITIWAPAYRTNRHFVQLYEDNTTVVQEGAVQFESTEISMQYAYLRTVVSPVAPTAYSIRQFITTARATDGLGVSGGLDAANSIFSIMEIIKVG